MNYSKKQDPKGTVPLPSPNKQGVRKRYPLFKHDLAGRQAQHPPQWRRLNLAINSFSLALLIFYEITRKNSKPKGERRERITSFRSCLPSGQLSLEVRFHTMHPKTVAVSPVDAPWTQALVAQSKGVLSNQTNLHQVA